MFTDILSYGSFAAYDLGWGLRKTVKALFAREVPAAETAETASFHRSGCETAGYSFLVSSLVSSGPVSRPPPPSSSREVELRVLFDNKMFLAPITFM